MRASDKIPFLDLVSIHQELREELCQVFQTALSTGCFVGGPMVEAFEQDFARFCGVRHCVGVASGTDALRFALMAAGVRRGDVVVTVPNTFIATAEAITQAGARPTFVDIDERTCNMDPEKLREYLETRCRLDSVTGRPVELASGRPVSAVVPVHLYGQPADMDPIQALADRCGLIVVEDACQAHGAEYFSNRGLSPTSPADSADPSPTPLPSRDREGAVQGKASLLPGGRWRKAGSMGRAAAFSFYPGKNLGACGEGGAVTTDDPEIARRIRMLRDHGQARKYYHEIEGYNGRLDAIQAGILQVKLRRLPDWNESRRACARRYAELLAPVAGLIALPHEPSWARAVHHLYVVRVPNRAEVQQELAAAGIGTGIHYPIPLHLQRAYSALDCSGRDLAVSERTAPELLSLPMFPGLEPGQQERVAERLKAAAAAEAVAGLSEQVAGR
ncbi:MAG: DegT/DnrJ/EryC1/StrS family aminotransferase [Bryobacterales bacterium]|nr:DegT/DnrJ/EryC1/StrS family aminotransferase [Bryobacterales bacterium]